MKPATRRQLIMFPISLLYAISSLLSLAAAESSITYPSTVEFDVLFPRNDTYAPAEVFPIIFAVQNPAAIGPSSPMRMNVRWHIVEIGQEPATVATNWYDETALHNKTNSSEPYFANFWTSNLNEAKVTYSANTHWNGSAAKYELVWSLHIPNKCFGPPVDGDTGYNATLATEYSHFNGSVGFTVKPGAQQPILSTDSCLSPNVTLELTGILTETSPDGEEEGCGFIAQSQPPADPCAVKVDDTMASSISAALTADACGTYDRHRPTTGCPAEPSQTTDENAGSRILVGGDLGMGLVGPLLVGALLLVLR